MLPENPIGPDIGLLPPPEPNMAAIGFIGPICPKKTRKEYHLCFPLNNITVQFYIYTPHPVPLLANPLHLHLRLHLFLVPPPLTLSLSLPLSLSHLELARRYMAEILPIRR